LQLPQLVHNVKTSIILMRYISRQIIFNSDEALESQNLINIAQKHYFYAPLNLTQQS